MFRFRGVVLSVVLVSLFVGAFVAAQQPGRTLLDQARAKKAAGDLQGATEGFELAAKELATTDRNAAAKALLELGEIFESLGQAARARGSYARVQNEFKDQTAEIGIATERMARVANRSAEVANSVTGRAGPSRITIRTPYADDVYSFALSPDGKTLVLQGTSPDGRKQLWRQAVDASAKPEPIAGTEGAGASAYPFFSPDGKTIGFFAKRTLWQVDLAGGTPRELAPAPSPWGAAWVGGSIVMTARGQGGQVEVLEDGKLRPLTAESAIYQSPKVIDDRRFIYFKREGAGGKFEAGSLGGAPASSRGLPAAHAAAFTQGYLLYVTRDGVLHAAPFDPEQMAVSGPSTVLVTRVGTEDRLAGVAALAVSASGVIAFREAVTVKKQMMWMGRNGDLLGTVGAADTASPGIPRVSPDGRSVLFYRQLGVALGSLWAMDTETGSQRMLQDGTSSAMWSPAGDRLIMSTLRNGVATLVERPVNAANNAGRVLGPTTGAFPEDIAQNGAVLYRAAAGSIGGDLFVIPPNQNSPVSVAQTAAAERNARFSSDGNWIAYQSDEGGRNEVYVQPFPGTMAQRQRLSLNGGVSPQWGRKGRELYFLSADNRLMVATVEAAVAGERPVIEFSTPKPLFNAPIPPGAEYDTVSDGDRFLILAPVEDTPPIFVLSNWQPAR